MKDFCCHRVAQKGVHTFLNVVAQVTFLMVNVIRYLCIIIATSNQFVTCLTAHGPVTCVNYCYLLRNKYVSDLLYGPWGMVLCLFNLDLRQQTELVSL